MKDFDTKINLNPNQYIDPVSLVVDGIYRGGQPTQGGFVELAKQGIHAVVSLVDNSKYERPMVKDLGMSWFNVVMSGWKKPNDFDIETVLSLLRNPVIKPIFVHCKHGHDRTGTVIACYRIRYCGWTREAALEEAEKYGMSWTEILMKEYIEEWRGRA